MVFLELHESSHHVGSRYRLRLTSVLHQPLDELFYKLLSGFHLAVNQVRQ